MEGIGKNWQVLKNCQARPAAKSIPETQDF
jgi:hypothetical protein